MDRGRANSRLTGTRVLRGIASLIVALLFLAQPLQALRLSCADIARLFPERCCCKSEPMGCCGGAADDAPPSRTPEIEPRFDCNCAIELPGTPPAGPVPEPRAEPASPAHGVANADPSAIELASAWRALAPRARALAPPLDPPRGRLFARLPCRASSTITELSVLGVARC